MQGQPTTCSNSNYTTVSYNIQQVGLDSNGGGANTRWREGKEVAPVKK